MNHATLDKYLVQVSQQPRGQPLTMSPLCATRVCDGPFHVKDLSLAEMKLVHWPTHDTLSLSL
jgi:hypothetical protein